MLKVLRNEASFQESSEKKTKCQVKKMFFSKILQKTNCLKKTIKTIIFQKFFELILFFQLYELVIFCLYLMEKKFLFQISIDFYLKYLKFGIEKSNRPIIWTDIENEIFG